MMNAKRFENMTVFHARTTTGRLNLACRSDVNFGVSASGKTFSVLWNNVPMFLIWQLAAVLQGQTSVEDETRLHRHIHNDSTSINN